MKMGREREDDKITRVVLSVFKGPQERSFLLFAFWKEIIIFSLVISRALELKEILTQLQCVYCSRL